MLFRTPLTPVVSGLALDVAGGALAEPVSALLYAGSIVAWAAAALTFGPRVALATSVALLAYPGYALMFHELASETVFAAAFALFALLVARAASRPSVAGFVLVGLAIALLALARPGNAVLVAFALFPLALPARWGQRLRWAAAIAVAALFPSPPGPSTTACASTPTRSRGAATRSSPSTARSSPTASSRRRTATRPAGSAPPWRSACSRGALPLVRRHARRRVLDRQLPGPRGPLPPLGSGLRLGHGLRRPARAGVEASPRAPGDVRLRVLDTLWSQLTAPYYRALPRSDPPGDRAPTQRRSSSTDATARAEEGQPIPAGQVVWISRPDQAIRQVWTSPTEWHLEFDRPGDRARLAAIERGARELFAAFPDRAANATLAFA